MSEEAPPDRHAYLEEQIQRQRRGERIDVDWVRAELDRVKRESQHKLASSERRLRWLVVAMSALFAVFWLARTLLTHGDPWVVAPVFLIVALAVWALRRHRRR